MHAEPAQAIIDCTNSGHQVIKKPKPLSAQVDRRASKLQLAPVKTVLA